MDKTIKEHATIKLTDSSVKRLIEVLKGLPEETQLEHEDIILEYKKYEITYGNAVGPDIIDKLKISLKNEA